MVEMMHRDETSRSRRSRRGFTLVELMVAIALLGLVMTVIFALFGTTSDSLVEADSLANTLERARFGIERISGDLRTAGAFASPDSLTDPNVQPKNVDANSKLLVAGVASYSGWQNDRTPMSADVQKAHTPTKAVKNQAAPGNGIITGGTPFVSFDGFIVMGALDYPQSFEIANLKFGTGTGRLTGAWIPATPRSLNKLLVNDPFYTAINVPGSVKTDFAAGTGADEVVAQDMQNRVLRVMDRQGKLQFSGISGADVPNFEKGSGALSIGGINFDLTQPMAVRNSAGDGQIPYGIDRSSSGDQDIRYDAALVDAYWYHVEADPENPVNYRLVRERLNAGKLAEALMANGGKGSATIAVDASTGELKGSNGSLSALTHADGGGTDREKIVLVDRVVDFQVWFDCADASGNVQNTDWQARWANPLGVSDTAHDCMDPTNPDFGRARMAHVRLSVRTEHERKDAPDDPNGLFMNEAGEVDAAKPLRYFNMNPDAPGAARVVTVQTDIELTNFSMHNL